VKKPGKISLSVFLFILTTSGILYWLLRPPAAARDSGPMPHQAYVWQQAWTPAVLDAVRNADNNISRLVVLAAKISFRNGSPRVVRIPLDYGSLKKSSRPIGIALRIRPFRGPFSADDGTAAFVAGLAARLVRQARERGLEPAELQVDFDCAESKLDGYRLWVQAVRKKISPTPVTITVLPCWLKHRSAFGRLAAAADGYVLQVHSFKKPEASDKPCLCDKKAARKAVERAARFGRPFRVALPTYGYVVAFDDSGRLLGISAEGAQKSWPAGARVGTVRSDPADMADLVRAWTRDRPENLLGIIWYRLPVATDRLNWKPPTLAAVMSGKTPEPELAVRARGVKPGLHEIELVNNGLADACANVSVSVRWSDARLIASDGLGGFRSTAENTGGLVLQGPSSILASMLGPGEKRTIGWIRLSGNSEVKTHVQP
jgi:hypothetical protein